jgi:hypothetical protein
VSGWSAIAKVECGGCVCVGAGIGFIGCSSEGKWRRWNGMGRSWVGYFENGRIEKSDV